jgi:enamidase
MRTLLRGAAAIVSGDPAAPLIDGDALVIDGTVIEAVGPESSLDTSVDRTIDVGGAVLAPGLIDPHTHPVLGDFTPRQNTLGWTGAHLNGGVTTLISAGETHWPGRQRTRLGAKTIAMAAALSSQHLRPGGVKLHGGALLIEPDLTPADFDDMAEAGVHLVGEIGLGSSMDPDAIRAPIEEARRRGWVLPMHVGGASVPGSHVVGADMVLALRPDVVCHANGGPTARPLAEIDEMLAETDAALEVVQAGNTLALVRIVERLLERGETHRLQYGTDSPSGTGVLPLGMLRTVAYSVALAGMDPAVAIGLASGGVAARYGLDVGRLEAGRPADIAVLDVPLGGQGEIALDSFRYGDVPSVAMVLVDGEILVRPSRVTPPPTHPPVVS